MIPIEYCEETARTTASVADVHARAWAAVAEFHYKGRESPDYEAARRVVTAILDYVEARKSREEKP